MAIHKASFSNTEIIIQALLKHPWLPYLNSVKRFLPRTIEEGVSGIQTNCFAFSLYHTEGITRWRSLEKSLTVNTTKS